MLMLECTAINDSLTNTLKNSIQNTHAHKIARIITGELSLKKNFR